jgi:hypothetical protein
MCVCAYVLSRPLLSPAPPPLRPPSLNTLSPLPPLSSLSRPPSPTTVFSPRPPSLSPPSLLKLRESGEDRPVQMAQLIAEQIEVPAEDTGERGRDKHGR